MAERAGFACSLLILALAFGGSAVRAEAAGFDCASARTAVEKAICGDAALSELDGMLAATFKTAYAGSDDKSALLAGQRFWLSRRAECVRSAGDDSVRAGVECLADRYRRRNAFLDRKTALEPANICHAMADAVTYAHGYVTMRPGYLNDKRILDLVALDTLGILNIHEPISERHIETHRAEGGVDINLIRKIKKLDTEDGAWSRHYYVLGSGRKRLAVSEFESGTLYCQTSSFYRFGEAGALGEVEVDRPDGCGEDLDYFADTPAGGPRVSPTIIHETPAITNVQIGAENWDGRSFVPLCLMTVTYDLTLRMNEASCEEKTGCDALSKQAMKLAREFETETGRQKWSPPWISVTDAPDFADAEVPSNDDWYHAQTGSPDSLTYTTFARDASTFTTKGSKYLFRISHGIQRDFVDDGYVVGVYDKSDGNAPLAAFQISKIRTGLNGRVSVTAGQTTRR